MLHILYHRNSKQSYLRELDPLYHKDLLPLNYPWATELKSVLVTADREYPLGMSAEHGVSNTYVTFDDGASFGLDEYLEQMGLPTMADRIPLVAVGSNSSPLALRSKMKRYGRINTSQVIPVLTAKMTNLGLGYSAHLVSGGYVPAAPFRAKGEVASVTVSFLTRDQLRAIDATEPTYDRKALSSDSYPLMLQNGTILDVSYLYVSAFGVLEGPTGSPIPLGTQADLYSVLSEHNVGDGFFDGTAQEVSDRIAGKRTQKPKTSVWSKVFDGIIVDEKIVADRPDIDPVPEFFDDDNDPEMWSRWYQTPSGKEYMSDTVRDYLNDRAMGEYGEFGDDYDDYDDYERYESYRGHTSPWEEDYIPMYRESFRDPWDEDAEVEAIVAEAEAKWNTVAPSEMPTWNKKAMW